MTKKKIKFSIKGMHCGSCAAGIQMVLQSTEGVLSSSAEYKGEQGQVEFDQEKVKFKALKETIEEMGYQLTEIKK